jgi:hypothetical protein
MQGAAHVSHAAVAQLARASACHAEGRGFESLQPLLKEAPQIAGFFCCPIVSIGRCASLYNNSVQQMALLRARRPGREVPVGAGVEKAGAGDRNRGERAVSSPMRAAARRLSGASCGPACASSGRCSRPAGRRETPEAVAKEWRPARNAGDCSSRVAITGSVRGAAGGAYAVGAAGSHDESVGLLVTTEQREWAIRRTSASRPLRREIHQLMSSVCRMVVWVRRAGAEPGGSGSRLWVYPPARAARTLA